MPYTLHTLISRLLIILNTVLVVTRVYLVISDKGNVYIQDKHKSFLFLVRDYWGNLGFHTTGVRVLPLSYSPRQLFCFLKTRYCFLVQTSPEFPI